MARHQHAAVQLTRLLANACPPDLMVMSAPFDWKRSEGTVFQPDLLVFRSRDCQADGWLTTPRSSRRSRLALDGTANREVGAVRRDEPFEATRPFPVSVVPAALTR